MTIDNKEKNNMSILIGITGRAGSGKDTVAGYLQHKYGFVQMAFANPLKAAASVLFNIPEYYFHDRELKERVVEDWDMSPRRMAQILGTEAVRTHFGADFWIKRWLQEYRSMPCSLDVVLTDVRFNNEAQAVRDLGGTILHTERPGDTCLEFAAAQHASEAGVHRMYPDVIIVNDGTLDELFAKVDTLFSDAPLEVLA